MKREDLERINAVAGSEFNFDGQDYGFEGQDYNYDGAGEFDFDGQVGSRSSFAQELGGGRAFQVVIVNTFPTVKIVAICPGMYTTVAQLAAAGIPNVDAILNDGIMIETAGVGRVEATAAASNQSIYTLKEFVKRNPSRITHMSMVSDKENQFEQTMAVQLIDPFSRNGSYPILLTDYRPPSQLQKDKITMNLLADGKVIDMNDQNVVTLPIEPASKLSITFRIGGVLNPAKQLKTAARVAHGNIRRRAPHAYMKR